MHEQIDYLCENIKHPRMNSQFLSRMSHTRNMMATEITSLMIDHLINEHNEVIGEIEAFKLLVIINKEILDTALKRMTNLKKHERWDNNTYHGLMRKVSNFLVYDDKCSLMTTYNNEGQFDVQIPTEANNNAVKSLN